jgi:MOSC domain-containing protein YiiM
MVGNGLSHPVAPGRIVRIGIKGERPGERGLPKPEVESVRVTEAGLTGDFNRYRHEVKSDDPGMAILFLPTEVIRALNDEGWPVHPGDMGENFTTEGLDPRTWTTGRRLALGDGAIVELTKPCTPCDNLWLLPYVGRERGPEFLRTTDGRRGFFARVVRPGVVHRGDPIRPLLESAEPTREPS